MTRDELVERLSSLDLLEHVDLQRALYARWQAEATPSEPSHALDATDETSREDAP